MGCSASRPETLLTSQTIEQPLSSSSPIIMTTTKSKIPNPVSRTSSLPNHLVHHLPLRKGDTHHLVSLTSTTYGSLLLIDSNPKDLPSSSSSSSLLKITHHLIQ
ncbi:hypothetical protein FRX31_020231 [Thalictrum thalictroides]|uniref:Uncharacterized protein n=1 Tax=Thalictrum thalictroides TaxID=46969 RepID=A0A7J6W0Q8_THATH|nr:hypothetical protein FRX31_020231 [Thalictrum thalictroides]